MADNVTDKDVWKLAKDLEKDLQITQLSIKHGIDNLIETDTKLIQGAVEQLKRILLENLDYISNNFEKQRLEEAPELNEDNILWQKEQDLFYVELELNKEKETVGLPPITDHQKEDAIEYLKKETKVGNKYLKQLEKQLNTLKQQSKMLNETVDAQKNLNEHLTVYKMELSSTNEPRSQLEILKDKYERLKTLENYRAKKLGELCNKIFPSPDGSDIASVKSSSVISFDINMKSMAEILEILLNRYINFRHDPWVSLDDTFWVGHINTLKKVGIIKSKPNNSGLITLDCDI